MIKTCSYFVSPEAPHSPFVTLTRSENGGHITIVVRSYSRSTLTGERVAGEEGQIEMPIEAFEAMFDELVSQPGPRP